MGEAAAEFCTHFPAFRPESRRAAARSLSWAKEGRRSGEGPPPPLFLDVWEIRDFKSFVYGSVGSKGLRGHFLRMCGKQRAYGREWPKTQAFVGLEGRKPATGTR